MTNHTSDFPSVSGICARVNERVERAILERRKKATMDNSKDQDRGKGPRNTIPRMKAAIQCMPGQLGHRDQNPELKNDSDLSG
jgi:hypothetical protein